MYLIRILFDNGSLLNFTYLDVRQANSARETCFKAQELGKSIPPKPAICIITDDAGRHASIDGSNIMVAQMIDVEAEVLGDTRTRIIAGRAERDLLIRAGEMEEPAASGQNGAMQAPQMRGADGPIAAPPTIGGHFST